MFGFDPSSLPGAQQPGSMWQQFASDPANMLGLLNFGLQMLQPVQPGQSSIGHAAQAIGQGVTTIGQQKERTRRQGMKEKQLGLQERRVAADEGRLELEGRRVAEQEATGQVERAGKLQQIQQNERLFPKTISEIDAKIEKLKTGGKVDEAQAEYLRERARLYPSEVNADLKRAEAALTSAKKPSGTEALFESTAQAMVKAGEAKTVDEARARLGMEHFGRSSTSSATVQAANEFEKSWRAANPQQQGESEEAYNTRVGQAKIKFMESKKKGNYNEALAKYLGDNALMIRGPEDESRYKQLFDKAWAAEEPGSKPQAPAAKPQAPAKPGAKGDQSQGAKRSISKAEIQATAKARGIDATALERALKARGHTITD